MKSFRKFITEETDAAESYLCEFADALADTHKRIDVNGHDLFVPIEENTKLPNKMIASCFHGDEPAGWMGLMEFVKNYKAENVNISYLPIVSRDVFNSGEHLNTRGENANHNVKNQPSEEMSRLMESRSEWVLRAAEGFLDLHEDPWRDEDYVFSWSDRERLSERMINIIGEYFPLFEGGRIDSDPQGMLGEYLASLGVNPCLTTETAVLGHDLEHRIECTVKLIKEFLR